MKHKKYIYILIISLLSIFNVKAESSHSIIPKETYINYHNKAKTNLNFDIEALNYSSRMIKKTMLSLNKLAKRKKTTIDDIKLEYMGFVSRTSSCMDINLKSESFETSDKVTLVFDVNDTCSNYIGAKQKVIMINENGWKIDYAELSL